jgi:hypothetical protein
MSRRQRHFSTILRPNIEATAAQRQFWQQLNRKERNFPPSKSLKETPNKEKELRQEQKGGDKLTQVSILAGNYNPLFVDAIDVEQGDTDTCFALEELVRTARSDPDTIKNLIRPKGNGMYEVTIYINPQANAKPGEGKRTAVTITVDDTLPTSYSGIQAFTQTGEVSGNEKSSLWIMLIEKAYALYKGGANVSTWKHPGEAMATLSGNRSDIYYTNSFNEQQVAHLIGHALSKELLVSAFTPAMSDNLQEQAQQVNPGIQERRIYRVKEVNLSSLTIDLQHPQSSKFDISGLRISEFRKYFHKFQFSR